MPLDSEQDKPDPRVPERTDETEPEDSDYVTYHGHARSPAADAASPPASGDAPAADSRSGPPSADYETYQPAGDRVERVVKDSPADDERYFDEANLEEESGASSEAPTSFSDRATVPPRRPISTYLPWRLRADPRPRRTVVRVVALGVLLLVVASAGTTVGVRLLTGGGSLPNVLEDVAQAGALPAWLSQYDVAVDAGSVYVLDPLGRVIRLDASTLDVEAEISDPTGLTDFLPDPPATCGPKGLTALESQTLRRLWSLPGYCTLLAADTGPGGAIAVVQRVGDHARLCVVVRGRVVRCVRLDFVPTGIGVGPDGTIYVADGKNDRIVPYTREKGKNGKLKEGEAVELEPGANPHGDIVVKGGKVYVAVTGGVAAFNRSGEGEPVTYHLKSTPSGIWISPDGVLYAALYHSNSVDWFPLAFPRDMQSVRVDAPVALDGDESTGDVFVLTRDRIVNRIDPDTGTIVDSAALTSVDVPEPASIEKVEITRTTTGYVVQLDIAGGPLTDESLIRDDSAIRDGRASFLLWQGGIWTQVAGEQRGHLELRLREQAAGDLVRVIARGPGGGDLRGFDVQLSPDGRVVTVTVRQVEEPVAVPNVVGLPRSQAEARIRARDLTVGQVSSSSSATVPEGNVIRSDPGAGTMVAPGARVDLVVSTGPGENAGQPVTIPPLAGLRLADARAALRDRDLRTGSVTHQESSNVAAGRVISSSPAAGARVARGTAVDLVVSSGPPPPPPPVTVPDVIGESRIVAVRILRNEGLVPVSHFCTDQEAVVDMDPNPGAVVPVGTQVDLYCLSISTVALSLRLATLPT